MNRNTFKYLIMFFTFLSAGMVESNLYAQHDGDTKNKKSKALFDEGYIQYTRGEFIKTIELCNKAIRGDLFYFDAYELKAAALEEMQRNSEAVQTYLEVLKLDTTYRQVYYYLGSLEYRTARYEDAAKHLRKFLWFEGDFRKLRVKAEALLANAEAAALIMKENQITGLQNMGSSVNSSLNEYWPGMTIDGRLFVFTRRVDMQEDFYAAEKNDDTSWKKARPMTGSINTPDNEGTVSIPADGSRVYHTYCGPGSIGSCDLVVSDLNGGEWSSRENLGPGINTPFWESGPAISADGRTLVFSSARPGGYGGKDLWMSSWTGAEWTPALNLGAAVNTSKDEEAPFLHYDGITLYFASTGHPGLGNHDLFMSRLDEDGKWSKPVNLGSPVNTQEDEMGLYVDRLGKLGYFASDRPNGFGGLDIYSFQIPGKLKPIQTNYVKGNLVDDANGNKIKGAVEITDLTTAKLVFADQCSDFIIPLKLGGNYAFSVRSNGYVYFSQNFMPDSGSIDKPYEITARLKKYKTGEVTVLRNTFFDSDKTALKPESKTELDKVAEMLNEQNTMRIEISGHTDNTGKPDYNLRLSQGRAESVKAYLIAKGISAGRIETRGYGDTKPVAGNDTVEGKALNRRTEMKIIGL
jgi:outer membrane protein OmpA-like peptidoglycan-associated protein